MLDWFRLSVLRVAERQLSFFMTVRYQKLFKSYQFTEDRGKGR